MDEQGRRDALTLLLTVLVFAVRRVTELTTLKRSTLSVFEQDVLRRSRRIVARLEAARAELVALGVECGGQELAVVPD